MVNTAEIQVSLRAHLYGIKRLPQNQLKWLKSATEHNSRQLISEFANKQRHIELDTYVATGDSPYVLPGRPRIVGMHDDAVIHMTGSNPERCCLTRQTEYTLIDRVFPSASTFIGCPEDSVVVEAYGCVFTCQCIPHIADIQMRRICSSALSEANGVHHIFEVHLGRTRPWTWFYGRRGSSRREERNYQHYD